MQDANANVLRALAKAIADTRAGAVEAVAIITVSPDGVPDVVFGGATELMPSAYLGAGLLKARIEQQAMGVQQLPVTTLRAGTG